MARAAGPGHRTPASRRRFSSDAPGPAALPSVRHGHRLDAPHTHPWKLNGWFSLAFMRPRIPPGYRRVSVARERSAEYRLGACSHFTHRNPTDEFPAPQSIPGDPARPACGGKIRGGSQARTLRGMAASRRRFASSRAVIAPIGRPHGDRLANTRRPSESRVHRAAPRSGDRETKARLPLRRISRILPRRALLRGWLPPLRLTVPAARGDEPTARSLRGFGKGAAPASRDYAIHPAQSVVTLCSIRNPILPSRRPRKM
jgi:hypothetical protein